MRRPNPNHLLRDRKGKSNNYNGCPVHIPIEACAQLFEEAGVTPEPKAVGVLGDVLENFALHLLRGWQSGKMSHGDLAERVRSSFR